MNHIHPELMKPISRTLRDVFVCVNSAIGDRAATDDETALLAALVEAGRIASEMARDRVPC